MAATAFWKIVLRWGAGLGGLFQVVGATRELLTRPDRDVWVEQMGSVVSLHSLYLSASVVGAVIVLASAFPAVEWARQKSPSNKFRRLHAAIARELTLTQQDINFEAVARSQASKFAERSALRLALLKHRIETPDPAAGDHVWCEFTANLFPLSMHGHLDKARALGTRFARKRK